jgi:hypothetical protein
MLNDLLWLKSGAVMVATGGSLFHPAQKWRGVRRGGVAVGQESRHPLQASSYRGITAVVRILERRVLGKDHHRCTN